MARPKRNVPTPQYTEAAPDGSDDAAAAKSEDGEDNEEEDVILLSDSSSSGSGGVAPRSRGRGRGRGRKSGKAVLGNSRSEEAPKPKTPQKKSSEPARSRYKRPQRQSADSGSESEYQVEVQSSSSDDEDSDDVFVRPRARAPAHPDRTVRNESPVRHRRRAAAAAAAARKPRRKKARGNQKIVEPPKKFGWELSTDEEDDPGVWGYNSDAELVPEELSVKKLEIEQREPPPEMLMPLLPFQKEWLAWSLKQESGVIKGGILADEMGMGKTIQAISLIVAGRHEKRPAPMRQLDTCRPSTTPSGPNPTDSSPPDLPRVKATLVVCPLVAVIQWRNEISRFTLCDSVKVLIYHGPRRSITPAELAKYDIILTTYSIVEFEHRKHVMPPKDACQWCNRLFYKDRMAIHLRYFCGPHARKTVKQAKQVRRKITSVEDTDDSDETEEDLKGKKTGKGVKPSSSRKNKTAAVGQSDRGRKRKVGEEELENALREAVDVADAPALEKDSSKGNSVLHSVRWERIVLDEAHSIKDRRSSTARAVFALKAEYKWALSGTPLQNRVGELYSLVRFLAIHPYSYYFCRKCECKSLEYQFTSHGQKCECGHSPLLHFCWWNKFIANPIKRWGYVGQGRKAMRVLKNKVLSATLLRRTKLECASDLALPPRTAFLRRDAFDAREEDFYQALYTQSQSTFNTYVTAGTLVNNYAHIFDLLTRLRQAVDHPYLVVYSATASKDAPGYDQVGGDRLCAICHETAEDEVITDCNHRFCKSCLQGYIALGQQLAAQCPKCQKPMTVDLTGNKSAGQDEKSATAVANGYKRSSILSRIKLEQFQTSTKIDAVREEISFMLERDASAKAIIFSQFTSMLDLIGYSLKMSKIKFVKLDGSMSMAARDQMIDIFTNDADTKVFLMSLKAGGVALNLTVASNVFLMDPWWNPAVEQQAQDRIHRLGQFKPIKVIRFVIENTIEERILKLQEKKQLVFDGTVGGSSDALGRLTEEDLRFLFTN